MKLDSYSYAATMKSAIKHAIAPNNPHSILILILSSQLPFYEPSITEY